jgi:hypothetical protein
MELMRSAMMLMQLFNQEMVMLWTKFVAMKSLKAGWILDRYKAWTHLMKDLLRKGTCLKMTPRLWVNDNTEASY